MGAKRLPQTILEMADQLGVTAQVAADYKAKLALRDRLQQTLNDADRDVDQLHGELSKEDRDDSVEQFIAGTWAPRRIAATLRQQIADAHEKRSVARRAFDQARKQADAAENAVCKLVAEKLRPRYSALAGAIAASLRSLRDAVVAEREFADQLQVAGVRVQGVWNPVDISMSPEQIDCWIANAKRDGNI